MKENEAIDIIPGKQMAYMPLVCPTCGCRFALDALHYFQVQRGVDDDDGELQRGELICPHGHTLYLRLPDEQDESDVGSVRGLTHRNRKLTREVTALRHELEQLEAQVTAARAECEWLFATGRELAADPDGFAGALMDRRCQADAGAAAPDALPQPTSAKDKA